LRRDRASSNRAAGRILPATSLVLVACCLPSLAVATDIRCQRSTSLEVPTERLTVEVVDLVRDTTAEVDDTDLTQEFNHESAPSTPDLSSRARSMAILREIFGEPVTDDDALDVELAVPPVVAEDETPDPGALRRPAAGVPNHASPSPDMSVEDGRALPNTDARLPGASEQETLRYRSQMYRTDI
jgi:hypothetical protein